ncbi:MAG: hypothetical protein ABSC05_39105, partial [Candidatus Solibacter sp.]
HTFLSPGPRGITPAFGYGAPHSSARGTSTLPINALLSAHYGYIRPIGPHNTSPKPKDKSGWLVIFVSRSGKDGPLLPVGWYEDATFEDGYRERPEYAHDSAFPRHRNRFPYTYVLVADAVKVHGIPAKSRMLYPEVPAQPSFLPSYLYARDTDPRHKAREDYAALAERITALNPEALADAAGTSWSASEVEATVADYFDMLRAEMEGTPYNKTAHRNALLTLLSNRSHQAAEFKHRNISAALRDMGLTYISGYTPHGNNQGLLVEIVKKHLIANPELCKEIVELDVNPVDAPPDGGQFGLADIEVPPPQPAERCAKPTSISKEIEPATIGFAWQRRRASPPRSEDDCVCSKELAARLISTLLGTGERDEGVASRL